jgi:hypothetical protein
MTISPLLTVPTIHWFPGGVAVGSLRTALVLGLNARLRNALGLF